MRQLPDIINLLAYPWMRAQVMQYLLNPLARDGNLRLLRRYAPVPIMPMPVQSEPSDIELMQADMLRSVITHGYRKDWIATESYHDRMTMGGTDIMVDIGPDGDIILLDGCHRILALMVAGVPAIHAVVRNRYKPWLDLVNKADAIANGFAYSALPHPDFQDRPSARRSETRIRLIRGAIINRGIKSAIDIGCCSGALACDLSTIIPRVKGVDINPNFVRLAAWRARHTGSQATFAQGTFADSYQTEADLLCLMSILHHLVDDFGIPTPPQPNLLLEYPTPDEPILKDRPVATQLAIDLDVDPADVCHRMGYQTISDLGIDTDQAPLHRHIYLLSK